MNTIKAVTRGRPLMFSLAVLVAVSLVLSTGVMAGYHDDAAQEEEEAEEELRVIEVEMRDFYFEPDEIKVESGEEVEFKITNPSETPHTFTVYYSEEKQEEYEEKQDEPLVDISLDPGEEETVTVEMPDEEQELNLVCIPHENMDMVGTIIVE